MLLGNMIRNIRKIKNLTREEVCRDETELSVRQLARIENGESSPSLKKLLFIAQALDQQVEGFFNPSYLQEYYDLKKNIELLVIDYDNEKNIEIDKNLTIIYEKYYDYLPLEERMYVDCSATSHEIRKSMNPKIAKVTLDKYYDVVSKKKKYSANELAYLALQTWMICLENQSVQIEPNILKIHKNIETEDYLSIELVTRIQVNVASNFYYRKNYMNCLKVLQCAEKFAYEKKVFQRIPIIYMMKAKCFKVLNQEVEAETNYQKAIRVAEMLQLEGLTINIKNELQSNH